MLTSKEMDHINVCVVSYFNNIKKISYISSNHLFLSTQSTINQSTMNLVKKVMISFSHLNSQSILEGCFQSAGEPESVSPRTRS